MADPADEPTDADLEVRLRQVHELVGSHQEAMSEASRERTELITELIARRYTQQKLADIIGTSRANIGKLIARGPQVERALLGTGRLTVAVGSKTEAGKPPGAGEPVTSHGALAAYELIADTARAYGLDAAMEKIPPDGGHDIRLSRPNLIVIGSPRILPLLRQVLEADEHLGFGEQDGVWHLTEHGRALRSPRDRGEPRDYAYAGRLPRTDGRGTFLYLAGIHAQGTHGAALWLTENVKEIYEQVKQRRWSVLVECTYHPDTKAIESTARLTEIYTD